MIIWRKDNYQFEMTQEKIYFKNSKGDNLCGILSNPTGKKEKPVVILSHGLGTDKESKTYTRLQTILNEKNISTLRFDFFGHGESEGKFRDITVSEGVDDVLNAIDFLKKQGYSEMGLFGSSFGGMVSIIVASKTNDFSVLVLKSPVSNYEELNHLRYLRKELEEWKEKGYNYFEGKSGRRKLKYSFFEDFKNNNGYEVAEEIKIPTLIVHGSDDEIVPVSQSKKTAGLIENCKLEVIEGANHRYTKQKDFERMIKIVSKFIIHSLMEREETFLF